MSILEWLVSIPFPVLFLIAICVALLLLVLLVLVACSENAAERVIRVIRAARTRRECIGYCPRCRSIVRRRGSR